MFIHEKRGPNPRREESRCGTSEKTGIKGVQGEEEEEEEMMMMRICEEIMSG